MTSSNADMRILRLVRELDAQRQELVRERRRCNGLAAQVGKLRLALARLLAEKQQKQGPAAARAAPPPA
jgi:hypothetical protein